MRMQNTTELFSSECLQFGVMSELLCEDGLIHGSILKTTFGNWDRFNFPCTVTIFSSIKRGGQATP